MSERPLIGIDLGTTNSVVAVFEDDGPRVLATHDGKTLIPSVVALDDSGKLMVGAPAYERAETSGHNVAARFKPDMGSDKTVVVGGQKLTPIALSSAVLSEVKRTAETALGLEITHAVVTVPAWFREPQRRATLEAAELAGLTVDRLINEPTAAALAYGLRAEEEPQTVVVLDLGGGTFDVSVLELFDGVVDVRASVGDVNLGGEDFTDSLVNHLTSGVRLSPDQLAVLRAAAERAKCDLSARLAVPIDVDGQEIRVSRADFLRMSKPLLQRIQSVTAEALTQASIRPGDVDEILLVGGATRMPMVSDLATDLFRKPPIASADVDHAVAIGAAVQAALLADHVAVAEKAVADVLTHSLGISVVRSFGDQQFDDRFAPMLHRGTALPVSRVEGFSTLHGSQSALEIRVFEGEHRRASQNDYLGCLNVEGLPTHDDSESTESIKIRFTHDLSGLLEVEVTVDTTGEKRQLLIERSGSSDADALASAATALAALKTHPRDLLPNRWLLDRATRLVEMLVGDERDALDSELGSFEADLERGHPEHIAYAAKGLRQSIDNLIRKNDIRLD